MACTAIPSDFSHDLNNLHRSDSADGLIDRLEAASCALIDRPLKQIAPYKALKSFDFGSSRKPPPDVARLDLEPVTCVIFAGATPILLILTINPFRAIFSGV